MTQHICETHIKKQSKIIRYTTFHSQLEDIGTLQLNCDDILLKAKSRFLSAYLKKKWMIVCTLRIELKVETFSRSVCLFINLFSTKGLAKC